MPQMAPLNWLSLYLMFIITFILFCMMIYYLFIPTSPKNGMLKTQKLPSFNWKW